MRAVVITQQSAEIPSNIRFVSDHPEPPPPGPGEVRLRTLASALNHLDLWVAKGVPGLKLTYPRVSGSDACAEVVGLGAGVDGSWLGRRVILNAAVAVPHSPRPGEGPEPMARDYSMIGEHTGGTHAELFNAPVVNVQSAPDAAAPTDAAAFGLTHLTAWSMLVGKAQLRAGQWVLITGIGGGVALAALAICRARGARTIVTSRHQHKLDRAAALGADHGVLDTGADWSRAVRQYTAGRGVDLAVDSSGKATHLACIKSLARGGAYLTPGCTSGPDATTDLARVFWNQLRIIGSTMGSADEFAEVAALYRRGLLAPVVDTVLPAAQGPAAYARLATGEQFGKVVLDWS